jgi:phosphomannomutase
MTHNENEDSIQLDPAAFRAYDIRGVVPDQLNAAGAQQIARAFAARVGTPEKPEAVIVGRDVRLSGPELHAAAVLGLRRSGLDVIDVGQVATDEFYFACGTRGLPGMLVTASHNPPEYNGFKLVEDLPRLTTASDFKDEVFGHEYEDADSEGELGSWDVGGEFDEFMLGLVPPEKIRPLKVVVDASNGALGPVWKRLAKLLPVEVDFLYCDPDGSFPNHGNDIVQTANQADLCARVREIGADLGLIFDPDGDRCLVVDDSGESIPGDFATALLAVTRLQYAPGSTVVYDVRCSEAVPDLVAQAGGKPFVWRPGHVYIKPKMQEFDAVFGGELSGHMYFREFWFSDSGTLAGLTMLEYVSKLEHPLSEEVGALRNRYFLSGEINSKVSDVEGVLEQIRGRYSDGRTSDLSGIAVWYEHWKFVVRPSDNEPLLRLTVEADTQELMEAKRDELLAIIEGG